MGAGLLVERQGPVAVLTIDRPEVRNALDPPALLALAAAIDDAGAAPDVGAAVLTGAGERCFSAGADLRSLAEAPQALRAAIGEFERALGAPERVPLVAAVRGMAMGGGFEVMCKCDLVVAGDNARFGLPEVTRGLVPGGGAMLLPARIPMAVAMELALLGEAFGAQRVQALGLVNRVVPDHAVVAEAVALAARVAAQPPATVARIRHLLWTTATAGPAATAELMGRR